MLFRSRAQRAVSALNERVIDRAEILTPTTERTLTALLEAHEDSTSNQLAILTIPSLDGDVLEDYALRVAETWALGTEENDNGVLVLIAHQDRKIRIEVGYGLEGDLPDVAASRIINNVMVPRFRSGDFDGGVLEGTQAILGTLEGTYYPTDDGDDFAEMPWGFRLIFGGMFMLIPSIFVFFAVFTMMGCVRWIMYFFFIPFFSVGSFVLTGSGIGVLVVLILYTLVYFGVPLHPRVRAVRERAAKAFKAGKSAKIGPFTVSSGGSSSSGGGWSSGGSSFSGGGGSFGGGGASGGW